MNKQEAIEEIKNTDTLNINDRLSGQQVDFVIKNQVLDIVSKISDSQKVVVPQYVADWYEENKDEFYLNLHRVVRDFFDPLNPGYSNGNPIDYDFECWYYNNKNALQILVNMHQFGYEVEEEKRYIVKIKGIAGTYNCLNYDTFEKTYSISSMVEIGVYKIKFTRKELEANGFGWVFDCEGVAIEEVEE